MSRKLYKLRVAYRKAERKAKHVVKDMHYKSAHFLCKSFDNIFFPAFNSHAIAQGCLRPKVKRRLNMLSFFQFRCRLKETASKYKGVIVKRGTEAYTSKQCGGCGTLNEKLGGSEVFTCKSCNLVADRDVHAARNILLRHLDTLS